ncbi:elongin C [Paramecium bursaria]
MQYITIHSSDNFEFIVDKEVANISEVLRKQIKYSELEGKNGDIQLQIQGEVLEIKQMGVLRKNSLISYSTINSIISFKSIT